MVRWVLMLVVALSSLAAVRPSQASACERLPVLRKVVTAPARLARSIRLRRCRCRCCGGRSHREREITEQCSSGLCSR